jgi:hypothetical protein
MSCRSYLVKADVVRFRDVITHTQTIMFNGVVVASPRDFGIRHIGMTKYWKLISAIFDKPQTA